MAYIQRGNPPTNKILPFTLANFVGGLNNRGLDIEDNQASDLLNMAFFNDEIMQKRFGTELFDNFTTTTPVTFMDTFSPYVDPAQLVRATLTEVYIGETKVADVNGQVCGINYDGKYFFCDGQKLYVYLKTSAVAGTFIKVTGTNPNAYAVYEVINPPVFTPLDKDGGGIAYTTGVTAYDFTAKKVWYEPCKLEGTDTYKGTNVLPSKPKYIITHKGRLYISGSDKDDDNVFISDVKKGFYFPVFLPMQLAPNADQVQGMAIFDDAVIIGRKNDIYAIYGNTNRPDTGVSTFELTKLNVHTGFASQRALNVSYSQLLFVGYDGQMYALNSARGGSLQAYTTLISKDIDLTKAPINLNKSDCTSATSHFMEDYWYVSIKDKVLVYSVRHDAWTLYNGWNATCFHILDNVFFFSNTSGKMVKQSNNYLDLGQPFVAYWSSRTFDMGEPSTFKQFREYYATIYTFPNFRSDVRVRFEIDYADVETEGFAMTQIATYGTSKWGDRFINRDYATGLPVILGRRGKLLRITFMSGYNTFGTVGTADELTNLLGRINGTKVFVTSENAYYLYKDYTWTKLIENDLNQPMRVIQVSGEYELRGKR